MLQVPAEVVARYRLYLARQSIESIRHGEYSNWLRFFLEFCEKYQVKGVEAIRLHLFINKLKQKKQSEEQRRRAYHAISLYFKMNTGGAVPLAFPYLSNR